ncbi:hypothetical protein MVEN_02545400 [Mycena venus]|uniref:Uncharacterized protein n=1 Tax=Mycena venus TaxID=2733690 RepID=A0A8H6WRT3_9AGAR|nr:hypothetical protein MVEN_02545400 [Mycena venus]
MIRANVRLGHKVPYIYVGFFYIPIVHADSVHPGLPLDRQKRQNISPLPTHYHLLRRL